MGKFDRYAFNAAPEFKEAEVRKAFARAVPLKTLVIYCYDPRAAEIPDAVARLFGDEVFPGEVVHDSAGMRVASSTTIFPVVVAGGRAVDALRSITVAQHLFGLQNIVVVHHSHCGRRPSRPMASSMRIGTSTAPTFPISTNAAASASTNSKRRSNATPR